MAPPTKASVRGAYEVIAESYAAARRDSWPEVLAFLSGLPPRARVLDVGCGHGRHTAALASRGCRAFGLDFSRRLLEIGRASSIRGGWGESVAWIGGDATSLPFRGDTFDACLGIAVIHHLPTYADRLRVLQEVRRVLVLDGRAFVSAWDFDEPRFQEIRDARRHLPRAIQGDVEVPWTLPDARVVPRYYHLFREGELEALIIESGLHMETFFRASGNRFAVARRHG